MEQKAIVPISHYFPKDSKIIVNSKTKYYYPPKRKYLRLDVIQLYINEDEVFGWMTIVVLRLDPSDKFTYGWFSRFISEFYPGQDRFPYAKDYLINKFIDDLDYFRNNFSKHNNKIFVHREDLIKSWHTNQYKEYGVVYDFTNVPDLNEYRDKLSLVCLNPGPDGNPLGECSSVVNYFLEGKLMENRTMSARILRGWKLKKEKPKTFFDRHSSEEIVRAISKSFSVLEVLRNLNEVENSWNGDRIKKFIEENSVDISHFKSVASEEYYKNPRRCPICGNPLPYSSESSSKKKECCCRRCALELKRRRSFENFVKQSNRVHGNSYEYALDDFVDEKTKMRIYDKLFDEYFYQIPHNHKHGAGNPTRNMSSGERLVYLWLSRNNLLDFTKFQYILGGQIQGVSTMRVIIDFRITYQGKEYWIEYNGEQHYVFRSNGIFTRSTECQGLTLEEQIALFYKHVSRDANVRAYCLTHDITLIEIPYTKESYKSIGKILENVIFKGKDPGYVKIPEIRIIE